MTLRVAVVGNVAWNASVLARGLRRLGVEADSFDRGGGYFGELPQWDHGLFNLTDYRLTAKNQLWGVWNRIMDERTGQPVKREPWEKIIGPDLWTAEKPLCKPWYDTQEEFERDAAIVSLGWQIGAGARPREDHAADIAAALAASRTPPEMWESIATVGAFNAARRTLTKLGTDGGYDLLVVCGEWVTATPFLPKSVPYITFEHGTMRYVSSFADPKYRAPALGYKQADACVITNADVIEDASALGITHKCQFIPHPFDESRFTPGEETSIAQQYRDLLKCDLLLLAPARHSSSETAGSKRNDRILRAVAKYVREAEHTGAPKAALLMMEWGDPKDIRASQALVTALGLKERVEWLPCLPRPVLARLYRAADVVLDQFSDTVGSFGTTTVEAMSSGKPVITYYNPQVHEWALPVLGEHPPVLSARTVDEIYDRLVWQAKHPESRASIGKRGREWVLANHSLERVSKRHLALYEKVLERKKFLGVVDWNAPQPGIHRESKIEVKMGATA